MTLAAGRPDIGHSVARVPRRSYGVVGAVTALTCGAAVMLWLVGRSRYAPLLSHGAAPVGPAPPALRLVAPLTAWVLMVTAMMLPTAVPMFEAVRRVVARRPDRHWLLAAAGAGFLATWTGLGLLLLGGAEVVRPVVAQSHSALHGPPHVLGGFALIGAGLYQFSTLKSRCLERCRSPNGFLYRHWTGRGNAGLRSLGIGVMYGLSCVGCCWTLMLVLLAVGATGLAWMVVFAAVMAVEKNAALGTRLQAPLGIELVLLGTCLLVSSLYLRQAA